MNSQSDFQCCEHAIFFLFNFFFLVHFHFCLSMLYSYSYAIQNKNTINAQSNEKNQLVSRAKKYTYDPKI